MNIFVDIPLNFVRQPIKLAITNNIKNITFVATEDLADIVIGTPETIYIKPSVILSDDPHTLVANDSCLAISPVPTSPDEIVTLMMKISECVACLSA